jgi:hypothetical protein
MKYRIKNLHDATLKMFHSKNFHCPKLDKENERNDLIMKRLFDDTMSGKIKGFYLVDNEQFKAYHKSTKEDNKIQYSYGFYRNGELIPCGDCQFSTFKDMQREGFSSGFYELIA